VFYYIYGEFMQDMTSISSIIDTEEKAKRTQAQLEKEREKLIFSTKTKADKLIQEAEEKAKIIKETAITTATKEAENEKKKILSNAEKKAKKILSVKLSKTDQEKLVSAFIKEIL
jgi:vacuolar-type H+-ATPase subunit H